MRLHTMAALAVVGLACLAGTPVRAQTTGAPAPASRPDGIIINPGALGVVGDPGGTGTTAAAATADAAILDQARTALAGAGQPCTVSEAVLVGRGGDTPVYEAACTDGPGFIVMGSTPPQAIECSLLAAGTAERRRDHAQAVIDACRLPANTMSLERITVFARAAGVGCDIDEAAQIGRTPSGAVFEVGCRAADGYWVQQTATGWSRAGCLSLIGDATGCRFTTTAEQGADLTARMAGRVNPPCAVTRAAYMGAAGSDDYVEVVCEAGEGFVLRLNARGAVAQVWPCAAAATIGGGCTLTRPD
jgi:hypothetical protein